MHELPLPSTAPRAYLDEVRRLMRKGVEESGIRPLIKHECPKLELSLGTPLAEICLPQGATSAQIACDLAFRPLEDALRLCWKWMAWDGVAPSKLGFQASGYPQSGLAPGLPTVDNGPKNLLYHLLAMRTNVYLTIEDSLARSVADMSDRLGKGSASQGGVSRKPRTAYFQAPDPTSAESIARVLLQFEGATPEAIEAFVVPHGRIAHGGKTSQSNIILEARSDRAQLREQVEHWRSIDDWVIHHLAEDEKSEELERLKAEAEGREFIGEWEAYWSKLAADPLVTGLSIPSFQRRYLAFWIRNPHPTFDKDHQYRNDPVVRSATLLAPYSPLAMLRGESYDAYNTDLIRNTVLVDFMDTVRYLSQTDPADVVLPSKLHWLPESEPSTEWERNRACDVVLDPKATLFADLSAWTSKTATQLTRLPKSRQFEKAEQLKEALNIRIQRALIGLTFGLPSVPPQPDRYGWHTARSVCLNRAWKSGLPLGRNARNNYLILAAIFYRVNHAMEEMSKAQAIVDAIDKARYAAKHGKLADTLLYDESGAAARLAAAEAAADEENAARLAAEEEAARTDDNPPSCLEQLDPDGTNPFPMLLAQHEWRMLRMRERMREHYAKQAPRDPEQERALDRLHLWNRFARSHVALARAILDGERCDDAFALDEDLCAGRLSRLTLNYPSTETTQGEETMRALHACLRLSDAVYAVPTNPSAGAATATAAAQVTARLGADEAPLEEMIVSGQLPATVRTALDGSRGSGASDAQEVPKKRRGRPPKNAPGVAETRRSASKLGRPSKAAKKQPKVATATAAAAERDPSADLPVPLPLDANLEQDALAEEMSFYNRMARAEEGAHSDDDILGPGGLSMRGVADLDTAAQILEGMGEELEEEIDPFAGMLEVMKQSEQVALREDDERQRLASRSNVVFGRHGAMGIAVGTTDRGQTGAQSRLRSVSTHSNYWVTFLRKIQLRPCALREWSSQCDQLIKAYPECYDFVLDCLSATLLGQYRHCRNPAPFDLVIKVTRAMDLARRYDACRHVMLAIIFAHNELVITSLREALVRQMEHDPGLWMLNGDWIRGAAHVPRAVFVRQGQIGTVETIMSKGYGALSVFAGTGSVPSTLAIAAREPVARGEPAPNSSHWLGSGECGGADTPVPATPVTPSPPIGGDHETDETSNNINALNANNAQSPSNQQRLQPLMPSVPHRPSIYRVIHPNYTPYMDVMFRITGSEAVLVSAARRLIEYDMEMSAIGYDFSAPNQPTVRPPSVYRLSEATLQLILWEVQRRRPGADIPLESLRRIGVSESGCAIIRATRNLFMERAHDQSVRTLICSMTPMDFELCAVYFRFLHLHSKRSILPLDASMTRRQVIALRKNWRIPDDEPIPLHAMCFGVCNIAACREMRNLVVPQTQSTRSYGLFWVAYDEYMGGLVCLSKKCIGVSRRNTSVPKELRTRWYEELGRRDGETDEAYVERLGNVFYGQFQMLGQKPQTEFDEARQQSYPSHAHLIAESIATFAKTVWTVSKGRMKAEPADLLSEELFADRLRQNGVSGTEEFEAAMSTFQSLRELCAREARQREESQYTLPCYRSLITFAPALGYVCGMEAKKLTPYTPCTICPGCGALAAYSTTAPLADGPNGFTCGVCDWIERQRFLSPRCIICYQSGLKITITTRGCKGLYFAKELRQIRILDDIEGGTHEWRIGFVCMPCFNQSSGWIAPPDSRSVTGTAEQAVPVIASHVVAGYDREFRNGGRNGLKMCEDISVPSKRALKTRVVGGAEHTAFPPQALYIALGRWIRGVTREHLRQQKKYERRMARLAKKAKPDRVIVTHKEV